MNHESLEHEHLQVPFDIECAMGLSQLGGWVDLIGRWLCSDTNSKTEPSEE